MSNSNRKIVIKCVSCEYDIVWNEASLYDEYFSNKQIEQSSVELYLID